MDTDNNKLEKLHIYNRRLSEENKQLKARLENKKIKLLDDTVDGIVATVIICATVGAFVLWLSNL